MKILGVLGVCVLLMMVSQFATEKLVAVEGLYNLAYLPIFWAGMLYQEYIRRVNL